MACWWHLLMVTITSGTKCCWSVCMWFELQRISRVAAEDCSSTGNFWAFYKCEIAHLWIKLKRGLYCSRLKEKHLSSKADFSEENLTEFLSHFCSKNECLSPRVGTKNSETSALTEGKWENDPTSDSGYQAQCGCCSFQQCCPLQRGSP